MTIDDNTQKKVTIIKDRVGCVRTPTLNLPPEDHVYGKKNPEVAEGSAEIISNWVTANPSLEKKAPKMIVYSNVLAIKKGCITAKSIRQYAQEHPNIRMKESLPEDSIRVANPYEGPFGVKTKFADESMADILQGKYTNYDGEDADYPKVDSIKKVGHMPVPRSTVASQSVIIARQRKEEKEQVKKPFIMKRFQNVKSTIAREREEREKIQNQINN